MNTTQSPQMNTFSFTVYGKQQPAGSKRGFIYRRKDGGQAVAISDANKNSRQWKSAVTAAAVEAFRGPKFLGPVKLDIVFWLPRPKGHYGTGRNEGVVKESAPVSPISKPDLLKLARAVEDALTDAGVWRDDSQVVIEHLEKQWVKDGGNKTDVSVVGYVCEK